MAARIVGVVLGAGAGRRFGRPKVTVAGWLDAAVAALRDGGCSEVVVVLGAARVPVGAGVTAVVAENWANGVSASVRAGVVRAQEMGADYVALHVVDTPDVGAQVVARVIEAAVASPLGVARASFAGRPGHPVVIGRQHWGPMLPTLTGDRGAARYLRAVDVRAVECGDLAGGLDIDEPREAEPPDPTVGRDL